MTETSKAAADRTIFHLRIADGHASVHPPDLRERLAVEAGDVVVISTSDGQSFVYKVDKTDAERPLVTKSVPDARGLLADYVEDWNDINRFVQEERHGRGRSRTGREADHEPRCSTRR